jgi:golgin subfamily B member 1
MWAPVAVRKVGEAVLASQAAAREESVERVAAGAGRAVCAMPAWAYEREDVPKEWDADTLASRLHAAELELARASSAQWARRANPERWGLSRVDEGRELADAERRALDLASLGKRAEAPTPIAREPLAAAERTLMRQLEAEYLRRARGEAAPAGAGEGGESGATAGALFALGRSAMEAVQRVEQAEAASAELSAALEGSESRQKAVLAEARAQLERVSSLEAGRDAHVLASGEQRVAEVEAAAVAALQGVEGHVRAELRALEQGWSEAKAALEAEGARAAGEALSVAEGLQASLSEARGRVEALTGALFGAKAEASEARAGQAELSARLAVEVSAAEASQRSLARRLEGAERALEAQRAATEKAVGAADLAAHTALRRAETQWADLERELRAGQEAERLRWAADLATALESLAQARDRVVALREVAGAVAGVALEARVEALEAGRETAEARAAAELAAGALPLAQRAGEELGRRGEEAACREWSAALVGDLATTWLQERAEELDGLRAQHVQELVELRRSHEAELRQLNEEHEKKVEQAEAEQRAVLSEVENTFATAVMVGAVERAAEAQAMREEAQAALAAERADRLAEIEALQRDHERRVRELAEAHCAAMELLRSHVDHETAAERDRVERLRDQVHSALEELDRKTHVHQAETNESRAALLALAHSVHLALHDLAAERARIVAHRDADVLRAAEVAAHALHSAQASVRRADDLLRKLRALERALADAKRHAAQTAAHADRVAAQLFTAQNQLLAAQRDAADARSDRGVAEDRVLEAERRALRMALENAKLLRFIDEQHLQRA